MAKSKWYSIRKGLSYILALSLMIGMMQGNVSALNISSDPSDTGWRVSVPMNGQFDYLTDQQTAANQAVSQDIVGNVSYPAFYTKYDAATDEIAFRFRLNAKDGKADAYGKLEFKKFAFVGVDLVEYGPGSLDFFVGIYNVDNEDTHGRIGVYNAGDGANASPNTTGIINPPLIQNQPIPLALGNATTANFDFKAADSSFSGNDDYFLSFKIKVADINRALQLAGKPFTITPSTAMQFIIGTASQDNSFNQDVGGMNGINTRSTTTWRDLGALTNTTSLQVISDGGLQVDFYIDNDAGTLPYTSLSAVSGYALGTLPVPVSQGAYFVEWFNKSDNSSFTSGSIISTNTSVYATWTTSKVSITFNHNYTVGISPNPLIQDVGLDTIIGPLIPSTSQTGYSFIGWNTASNGAGTYLTPNTKITESMTYYAIWEKNFTVTFDKNNISAFDGELANVNTISYTVLSGDAIGAFPEMVTDSTYYLVGWNTTTSAINYASGWVTPGTEVTQDLNLYAIWTTDKYTVNFDSGLEGVTNPNPKDVASGGAIGYLPLLTSTGALFEGWKTQSGDAVTEGSIFTSNTTIFGIWSPYIQIVCSGINLGNYPVSSQWSCHWCISS